MKKKKKLTARAPNSYVPKEGERKKKKGKKNDRGGAASLFNCFCRRTKSGKERKDGARANG